MIRIAVVDDDTMILGKIKELIEDRVTDEVSTDLYSDSITFYNNNNKWNYDIIFLDIDMPGMTGFEIAETIDLLKRQTAIVFVSNLEHLVYDSLKFRPFRFVRKSLLSDDVISALEAFIIEQKKTQDIFVIKTNRMTIPTPISDIVYFESMGHDIFVNIAEKTKYQLLRERDNNVTMKFLSEQYEGKGFIRIHKSYLVNYRFIYVIKASEVVLKNNETIIINSHKDSFKNFKNGVIGSSKTLLTPNAMNTDVIKTLNTNNIPFSMLKNLLRYIVINAP